MDAFSAIGDPTRRSIIEMLAVRGQLSASDIYNEFQVSHPAISQHLKVLRDTNWVRVEKRAQQRLYQLDMGGMYELELWTQKMTRLWNQRFDALDRVLQDEKKKLSNAKDD